MSSKVDNIFCFDLETIKNCSTATFVCMKTGVVRAFVIHESQNDLGALREFLKRDVDKLIGFNNVGFDYPVLHMIMIDTGGELDDEGEKYARKIYKRANEVLQEGWKRDYDIPLIPQLDLFRVHHFSNKARATSLKFLQINMGWKKCMEMPIAHNQDITADQIPLVLEYNLNDVLSTIAFYNLSKDKIRMRTALGKKYNTNFRNSPDTKIGEKIFLLEMSKRSGISEKVLSSRRTHRKNIILKDCIIEGIRFHSPEFNRIQDKFKSMVIQNTRKNDPLFCHFDGVTYEFGFGGLHAVRANGVYKNVRSADVASYYPNLAIGQRFYPYHLGEVFCDVYSLLYEERKQYKKGTDESNAIKLALNGVFGMSNAEWSPFYDPLYTMAITINGQLLLAQLCESITLSGAGRIIMANTDGIELDIKNEEMFKTVCDEWQERNKLQLEFSDYKTLAIRDVNNYIGVKTNGEVKEKGAYVREREIYKDQSMKIVTEAVKCYFVDGIPVEKTIEACEDIGMFLLGKRAKTGNLEYRRAETDLVVEKLPKNMRYYVSRSGGAIVKLLKDNSKKKKELVLEGQIDMFASPKKKEEDKYRIVSIHKGYSVTLFNDWIDKPFKEYNVNTQFYIREAKKLVDAVVKNQTFF